MSHTTSVGRLRRENDMRLRTGKTIGLFATALVASLSVGSANAGVLEFHDRDAWIAAVGEFTTIGFTEVPSGTFLFDQFASLGVVFTDGNDLAICCDKQTFPNDGAGVDGNGNIRLAFSEPQAWIAADFPGALRIDLFRDGLLIHSSGQFGHGGVGNFGGLISSELFDAAVLMDVPIDFEAEIDDLHFGVPACPADLDGDRVVAVPDLLTLLAAWGTNPGGPPDFDGDGTVAFADLLILLGNWGVCP